MLITSPTHPQIPSAMPFAINQTHRTFKPWKRRCRLLSFPHPEPILDSTPHRQPNFHRSLSTPCFSTNSQISFEHHHQQQKDCTTNVEIIGNTSSLRAKGTQALVAETAIALACGAVPIPASSGLCGAYFLRNRSNKECFAVIKPICAHSSETGLREVAAYLLDHNSFSGVPPTALIKISHPAFNTSKKIASIQRFVPHKSDAGDLGPSRFSVSSVHRIGILDVRLLNIDRHAGNILVRIESSSAMAELVPIDHGLCLPELLDDPYFEWLHWPQATVPFSDIESEYISALDPFKDAALLRSELPSLKEAAIRILIVCTIFLKRAAAEGLCLADIGGMMTREFCRFEEEPSMLEALCKRAKDSISTNTSFYLEDGSSDDDENSNEYDDDEERQRNFQFEMDCNDSSFTESCQGEGLDIPLFLRRKVLKHLNDEDDNDDDDKAAAAENEDVGYEPKLGSIVKSMSLSVAELDCEAGGSSNGRCISFNRMSEEEWDLFLEKFEQFLPEAIEERKDMGLTHRLGSSCKF